MSADAPNAQYANPVQLNHAQPRCPYCGKREVVLNRFAQKRGFY